jgi:hypothetical protein
VIRFRRDEHAGTAHRHPSRAKTGCGYRWSVPEDYALPEQQAPVAKPTDSLPIMLTRLAVAAR